MMWVARQWRQQPARMLMLAALLFLLPVFLHPSVPLPRKVYSVAFVVDITQSMNVRDANGLSRLAFAKEAIRHALRAMPCGSSASIGLFTERDVLMLFKPLEICAHFSVLDEAAANADWRMAWAADSFITHGAFRAIEETRRIGASTVVFMTDGHQAPPANPNYLPAFEGKPGEIGGVIAGIGGSVAQEIPHLDENDNITGYWTQDEVMQFATFGMAAVQSVLEMEGYHGRNAPHGGDPEHSTTEQMSALHEPLLQSIAKQTGLGYIHLQHTNDLIGALGEAPVTRQWVATDIRPVFACLSLLCFIAAFIAPVVVKQTPFMRDVHPYRFILSLFKKGAV